MSRETGWYRVEIDGEPDLAKWRYFKELDKFAWSVDGCGVILHEGGLLKVTDPTPVNPVPADEVTESASIVCAGLARNTYNSHATARHDYESMLERGLSRDAELHLSFTETRVVKEGE